ncbi:unnamed protein product [Pedinophyceae sp. YPF-701]|nr:unnamed protein product [Pedinophyceae sp. YPF-701]
MLRTCTVINITLLLAVVGVASAASPYSLATRYPYLRPRLVYEVNDYLFRYYNIYRPTQRDPIYYRPRTGWILGNSPDDLLFGYGGRFQDTLGYGSYYPFKYPLGPPVVPEEPIDPPDTLPI